MGVVTVEKNPDIAEVTCVACLGKNGNHESGCPTFISTVPPMTGIGMIVIELQNGNLSKHMVYVCEDCGTMVGPHHVQRHQDHHRLTNSQIGAVAAFLSKIKRVRAGKRTPLIPKKSEPEPEPEVAECAHLKRTGAEGENTVFCDQCGEELCMWCNNKPVEDCALCGRSSKPPSTTFRLWEAEKADQNYIDEWLPNADIVWGTVVEKIKVHNGNLGGTAVAYLKKMKRLAQLNDTDIAVITFGNEVLSDILSYLGDHKMPPAHEVFHLMGNEAMIDPAWNSRAMTIKFKYKEAPDRTVRFVD